MSDAEKKAFWTDVRRIAREARAMPWWKLGIVDRPVPGQRAKVRR